MNAWTWFTKNGDRALLSLALVSETVSRWLPVVLAATAALVALRLLPLLEGEAHGGAPCRGLVTGGPSAAPELAPKRVAQVGDVVKEGDTVYVKCLGIDDRGKVKLSMKRVDQATGKEVDQPAGGGDASNG